MLFHNTNSADHKVNIVTSRTVWVKCMFSPHARVNDLEYQVSLHGKTFCVQCANDVRFCILIVFDKTQSNVNFLSTEWICYYPNQLKLTRLQRVCVTIRRLKCNVGHALIFSSALVICSIIRALPTAGCTFQNRTEATENCNLTEIKWSSQIKSIVCGYLHSGGKAKLWNDELATNTTLFKVRWPDPVRSSVQAT